MDNLQEDALQPTIITYGTAISACGGSAEMAFCSDAAGGFAWEAD